MTKWSEEMMEEAIGAVKNGLSITKAAKEFDIPYSTLQGRVKGAVSRKEEAADRQLLTEGQESWLANWILIQEQLGKAPTHRQIRDVVNAMLRLAGINQTPGKCWVTNFFKRNPGIGTKQGKRLDLQRVKSVSPDRIKALFQVLNGPILQHIRPSQRYNMDETGIAEGIGSNGKHVGAVGGKASRWCYVRSRSDGAWVSIIECISAAGDALPPAVIYTGKSLQQQWFEENLKGYEAWEFAATPNGYTTNDVGYEWLTRHFVPLTDPGQNEWRLLVLDGHDSHVSDSFMMACAINRIYLCVLPPHSSHITQPLDRSVFASLKQEYRQQLESYGYDDVGAAQSKQIFLRSYAAARKKALTNRNIRSGWRATGLWPVDISVPLQTLESLPSEQPVIQPRSPIRQQPVDTIATPLGGKALKRALDNVPNIKELDSRGLRFVIRKTIKAMEEKNRQLVEAELQRRALELQIERFRPKKRMKVEIDPNRRFANIGHIQAAHAKARAQEQVQGNRGLLDIDGIADLFT